MSDSGTATGVTTPGGYRILDEPRAGALQKVAVNPVWPLLAVMLGGTWFSWPWFVVNAFAVGSPTKRREVVLVGLGFAGSFLIILAIGYLRVQGRLEDLWFAYSLVALVVWKLWISYRLYLLQVRTFELYRYFGGIVRNGLIPVIVAFYLRFQVIGGLSTTFQLLLS